MAAAAATAPLWLSGDFTPETLSALLAAVRPTGLVLEGGNEIKPGLRDFTELEAVFEALGN
jgi:phosphoribosylanthranilate isomerase